MLELVVENLYTREKGPRPRDPAGDAALPATAAAAGAGSSSARLPASPPPPIKPATSGRSGPSLPSLEGFDAWLASSAAPRQMAAGAIAAPPPALFDTRVEPGRAEPTTEPAPARFDAHPLIEPSRPETSRAEPAQPSPPGEQPTSARKRPVSAKGRDRASQRTPNIVPAGWAELLAQEEASPPPSPPAASAPAEPPDASESAGSRGGGPPKLVLHFDVNETILVGDDAGGDTFDDCLNKVPRAVIRLVK